MRQQRRGGGGCDTSGTLINAQSASHTERLFGLGAVCLTPTTEANIDLLLGDETGDKKTRSSGIPFVPVGETLSTLVCFPLLSLVPNNCRTQKGLFQDQFLF